MIQKKSTNKFLLTTSLFSLTMGMLSFNVMAANSNAEHRLEAIGNTVKAVNFETNVQFPKTNNAKAINKSASPQETKFRMLSDNEDFCFKGPDGKCMNCESSDGKNCNVRQLNVENTAKTQYNVAEGVKVLDSGYIVGNKEVTDSGNGNSLFFRYWDPTLESYSNSESRRITPDPQFSASFPKLCYGGSGLSFSSPKSLAKKNDKYADPLIRLTKDGGDTKNDKMQYIDERRIDIPVKAATSYTDPSGVINNGNNLGGILSCITNKSCRLVKDENRDCFNVEINKTYTDAAKIYASDIIKKNNNKGYKFNDDGSKSNITISRCPKENASKYSGTDCNADLVKSFVVDSNDTPYRQSAFVSIDINGNTETIEIPDQTCYKCVNVNAGPTDASCEYILKEVWEASKHDCEATVKNMVINPRNTGRNYLPSNMNTQGNCQTCLCKIEQILKTAPYNCQ